MPQIRDPVAPPSRITCPIGNNSRAGQCPQITVSETDEGNIMALERLRTMINVPPADRLPEWVNPLEKIEQLLTCAICLDRYKNPKLLPCQHSFCMDPCLDGLVDIVKRLVRCPECRAEHPLPYDGVKAFQTNYTLMGFLEVHLQATDDNASELESYIRRYNLERCKVCDEKSEVEYCPHCEKRICLECKSTHVDMIKRDLGRLMNQVKRLCTRITDTADTLTRGMDSMTVNCDNVKEEIRDYVKRYIKELKKREDALISEVDAFFNAETRMIKTVRDNLELESSNINEACARVEACLKGEREMGDEELVRFKQMFTDGLDYLRAVNPDADELTNKKLRFTVNDAHLLPHAITQFGELQICTPQYNHKLAQAEQIYVPRFLQLGLESDNYMTKRRLWDPSDSSTWQQQRPQSPMKPVSAGQQKQPEEDAYSSRYRRRQQLEEQAWNRIRAEHPQQQQRQRRRSPKSAVQAQEEAGAVRPCAQFDSSPWSRVQQIPQTNEPQQASAEIPGNNDSSNVNGNATPAPKSTSTSTSTPTPAPAPAPAPVQGQADSTAASGLPPLPPSSNGSGSNRRSNQVTQSPQRVTIKQQERKSTGDQSKQPSSPASTNSETHIPRLVPRPTRPAVSATSSSSSISTNTSKNQTESNATAPPTPPAAKEDRDLDKRVANIRKEYEQRQEEQQKTILQIQQRVRAHKVPVDVSSAQTASSEEEEEEEEQQGEPIPVHVYPRPAEQNGGTTKQDTNASTPAPAPAPAPAKSPQIGTTSKTTPAPASASASTQNSGAGTSNGTGSQTTNSTPFGKSVPQQQQNQANGTIDWKKYLIPAPSEESSKPPVSTTARRYSSSAGSASSAAVNEIVQRSSETSAHAFRTGESRSFNADDSWLDRRRRFVRSKTNPDFNFDVSSYVTSSAGRISRDSSGNRITSDVEQRRRRFGFRGEQQETAGDQRGSSAKARYNRRKTERSHSGYAMHSTGQNGDAHDTASHHSHSNEPSRFEISIAGNNDSNATNAAAGPGVRFYRVFTNPKIDYLSKGRGLMKFGCKGSCDGQFNWPRGVAIVPTTEEIVVCDSSNHRLQILDKRGRFMKTLGVYGTGRGEFDCLAGVCINKYRQFVVSDRYNHRVQIFDSTGRHLREFGAHGQTNGRFSSPWGVAVDHQGYIYVCDKDNHRVQIFQADGNFVGKFGGIGNREGQFQNPHFIACNRQHQLIVTDSSNHRVQVFDHNGHFLFSFGSEGFHDGQFKYPRGVAVDEQGFIAVADSGNNRIQIFYPDGRYYSSFGSWGSSDGQLKGVEGVVITGDGRIVVTDRENHRVQIF